MRCVPTRRAFLAGLAVAVLGGAGCGERTTTAVAVGAAVGPLAFEDLDGRPVVVAPGEPAATLVWFWSTLCPCVEQCEARIVALIRDYAPRGVRFVAVTANEDDDPERVRALLSKLRSPYPVWRDRGAREAARLGIHASASVAVLDRGGRLRYRGAIDDRLEGPTVHHARDALDAVLAGREPVPAEVASYGCLFPLP
jgi:hypothetical protein